MEVWGGREWAGGSPPAVAVPPAWEQRALGLILRPNTRSLPSLVFLAGSFPVPLADLQCGREAFSLASGTPTPDLGGVAAEVRGEDGGRVHEPGDAPPRPHFTSSTETPSLVSFLPLLQGARRCYLRGGGGHAEGWAGGGEL